MSLPVSTYEELLATVRALAQEARQVQSVASPLLATIADVNQRQQQTVATAACHLTSASSLCHNCCCEENHSPTNNFVSSVVNRIDIRHKVLRDDGSINLKYSKSKTYKGKIMDRCNSSSQESFSNRASPENECKQSVDRISISTKKEPNSSESLSALYHGTWSAEQRELWPGGSSTQNSQEMTSVMSFASSAGSAGSLDRLLFGSSSSGEAPLADPNSSTSNVETQQLGAKADMVYGLLAMLGANESADMGHTLLALSSSPESCLAMRQSGCIPLLVQLVHSNCDSQTKCQASQALRNLVQAQPDERMRRRENRVLKLLEQVRAFCDNAIALHASGEAKAPLTDESDKHPAQIIANLMKLSFDEGPRIAICHLGGLQAIAQLIEVDHILHGSTCEEIQCITLRRYAGMALTNLTFGDSDNKALLCSLRGFMTALISQLYAPNDDLRQVTASVLRNLSWRADSSSKQILREAGTVTALAEVAMISHKESTLKSILSALWNLSAHCSVNKADICSVDGLLAFIVDMLSYKSPSKTLTIIENAGGILRNISSHIAVRDDYRAVLREHNCLQVLLQQLRSPSLTVVSNACGTLWNLSAKCPEDQKALWDMGAVLMLRSLTHSKHKMISMGSSAALKNLLNAKPNNATLARLDSTARAMGLSALPTLGARKQRALEQEIDQTLSETCDNIEPSVSPTYSRNDKFSFGMNELNIDRILTARRSSRRGNDTALSESRESVTSTHSDSIYERAIRTLPTRRQASPSSSSVKTVGGLPDKSLTNNKLSASDSVAYGRLSERETDHRFSRRYERSSAVKSTGAGMTYLPVRNKYQDCDPEDEQNASEQPVDYSKKYAETRHVNISKDIASDHESSDKRLSPCDKTRVEVDYGNYAVTDLDQPTDYSLRYAEDGTEMDESNETNQEAGFDHEDTVKTYYTEGTPYQTPFNFSTATSMSDLRVDQVPIDDKKGVIDNDRFKEESEIKSPKEFEATHDEKDSCSVEDVSKLDNDCRENENKKFMSTFKSGYSSGIMSPDKPVNYCEEGTPGYFSRVSSLSSLNSGVLNESAHRNVEIPDGKLDGPSLLMQDVCAASEQTRCLRSTSVAGKEESRNDRENKVVTFRGAVDYAEETPLMFSRTSSLASLDSVDQHSIHDDRSSVISDFSRRTSGVVSPSELPDSPTQTISPVPARRNSEALHVSGGCRLRSSVPQCANAKRNVFEDTTSAFKEENTPVEFSTATSLSSLTIDDEVKITSDILHKETPAAGSPLLCPVSASSPKRFSGIPVMKTSPKLSGMSPAALPVKKTSLDMSSDALRTYCTEDTPALLSQAGSISNLSELSLCQFEDKSDVLKNYKIVTSSAEYVASQVPSEQTSSGVTRSNVGDKISNLLHENISKGSNESLNSTDEQLLASCIQQGIDKCQSERALTTAHCSTQYKDVIEESDEKLDFSDDGSNTSADERLLAQCIQAGIDRVAKASQSKVVRESEDSVPVDERLSTVEAGISRMTISDDVRDGRLTAETLHRQFRTAEDTEKYLSDDGSNSSADERLLTDCIKLGMERVIKSSHSNDKLDFSDDSNNSADEKLLQECIQLGVTRATNSASIEKRNEDDADNTSITSADDRLLAECISMGIASATGTDIQSSSAESNRASHSQSSQLHQKVMGKGNSNSSKTKTPLTSGSQEKGIPERFVKTSTGVFVENTQYQSHSATSLDSSASLNESEQALLDRCIRAGMTKTIRQPIDTKCPTRTRQLKPTESNNSARQPNRDASRQSDLAPSFGHQQHPAYREPNYTIREQSRLPTFKGRDRKTPNFAAESKNVQVPSVTASAASANQVLPTHNQTKVTGAADRGTENIVVKRNHHRSIERDTAIPSPDISGSSPEELVHLTENTWTGEMKNGSEQTGQKSAENSDYLTVQNLKQNFFGTPDESVSENLKTYDVEASKNTSSQYELAHRTEISEYVTCAEDGTETERNESLSLERDEPSSEEMSLEDSTMDYGKPRDPDSMIASVDRLTAELVSHASHLPNADRIMKRSNHDTWNDSSDTNDLTFPSISASAPMITSIKSETEFAVPDLSAEGSPDDSKILNTENQLFETNSAMSDSTIIAFEASKIASIVQSEAKLAQSVTSLESTDLENVKPPSMMGSTISLSASWETQNITAFETKQENALSSSNKSGLKKKTRPLGLMVRRALSNSSNHTGSYENLMDNVSLPSSLNLDNVNPPSAMEYLNDMESSMISVASITSEMADSTTNVKLEFVPNGIVNNAFDTSLLCDVKRPQSLMNFMTGSANGSSFSDIENVNPPSLLNEVTDIYDVSLNEPNTETLYSDTDVFEDCLTHTIADNVPTLEEDNDVTEYSDANGTSPHQSDLNASSAESTPKKHSLVNGSCLTPKQRRQVTKERYKTYTVASEMVITEELNKGPMSIQPSCSEHNGVETISEDKIESFKNKMTPKQRRQEDRARYQTRVLESVISSETDESLATKDDNASESKSSIGYKTKNMSKQRRLQDKDRFKTRTLSEDASSSPESFGSPTVKNSVGSITPEDLHNLLEWEANIVLNTLNETHNDQLLECETISLVSNEDESEHNSVNYRTYRKSRGKLPCAVNTELNVELNVTLPVQDDRISSYTEEKNAEDFPHEEHFSESEQGSSEDEIQRITSKPKIIKPVSSVPVQNDANQGVKSIRGRRKPLYSGQTRRILSSANPKTISRNTRTVKSVSPNLVRSVLPTLKSSAGLKNVGINEKPSKIIAPFRTKSLKPPMKIGQNDAPKTAGSVLKRTNVKSATTKMIASSPKTSPIHKADSSQSKTKCVLERQGTFTKEDSSNSSQSSKSKIPMPASFTKTNNAPGLKKIETNANRSTKNIPRLQNNYSLGNKSLTQIPGKRVLAKSVSVDTVTRRPKSASASVSPSRSPSYDRDSGIKTRQASSANLRTSSSSQSLKGQRRVPSTNANGAQKEITSKIASLWKKVEENKRLQTQKKDENKVWITKPIQCRPTVSDLSKISNMPCPESADKTKLIRSSTFESVSTNEIFPPGQIRNGTIVKNKSKQNRNSYNFESVDYESTEFTELSSQIHFKSDFKSTQIISDGTATIVIRRHGHDSSHGTADGVITNGQDLLSEARTAEVDTEYNCYGSTKIMTT